MNMLKKKRAAVIAIGLIASQGSWADSESPNGTLVNEAQSSLLTAAFVSPPSSDLQILDEQTMSETQGELWPWIIGVVALDLSLASFFWGDYVPAVAATSGLCINCDIGLKPR